jgi:hypothetical protein
MATAAKAPATTADLIVERVLDMSFLPDHPLMVRDLRQRRRIDLTYPATVGVRTPVLWVFCSGLAVLGTF